MPMWLLISLLVLILNSINAADEQGPIHQEISGGNKQSSFHSTRSVSGFTQPAIRALISSAKEVPTRSPKFRKFVKQGSVSKAVADFDHLKPTDVEERMYSTFASVGDLKVQFKIRDHRHNKGPTIQISDPSGVTSFKIIYIRNPVNLP